MALSENEESEYLQVTKLTDSIEELDNMTSKSVSNEKNLKIASNELNIDETNRLQLNIDETRRLLSLDITSLIALPDSPPEEAALFTSNRDTDCLPFSKYDTENVASKISLKEEFLEYSPNEDEHLVLPINFAKEFAEDFGMS